VFNSLCGTVTAVDGAMLCLETAGIEWSLTVSTTTAGSLPPVGAKARVFVHLHHREDQMALYGFASVEERSVFLDLLKVGGIGTRQAIRILSGMTVAALSAALDSEDVDALARIPGLGKKTAQKILLTLRGKLSIGHGGEAEPADELVEALANMGFERSRARYAVSAVRSESAPDEAEGELLRRSIVRLSRDE
jgi:holliday junction DNA helicase RuvA